MSGSVPQARVLGWTEKKATPALTALHFPSTDTVWPAALWPPQPKPLSLPCSLDRLHLPNLGVKVNFSFLKSLLADALSQQWKQKRKGKKRRGRRSDAPSISHLGYPFLQYWVPLDLVSLLATFQHRLWHPLHNNAKDAVGNSPTSSYAHVSPSVLCRHWGLGNAHVLLSFLHRPQLPAGSWPGEETQWFTTGTGPIPHGIV